jgi:hypothetical protein
MNPPENKSAVGNVIDISHAPRHKAALESKEYDVVDDFDKNIAPLVNTISEWVQRNNINFVFGCDVRQTETQGTIGGSGFTGTRGASVQIGVAIAVMNDVNLAIKVKKFLELINEAPQQG